MPATTTAPTPALAASDITVMVDAGGRETVIVPDHIASAMRAAVRAGWTEYRGQAIGESVRFLAGSWMHQTCATLIAAFASSPVCEDDDDPDVGARAREWATRYGELPAHIVGRSAIDLDTRWWVDYEATKALHVPGYVQTDRTRGGFYFMG